MFDTISLKLDKSMVNTSIDFMSEVGAKINVDIKRSSEYRIIGTYKNLKVTITPLCVYIEGSLPKYRYGSNLVTLSRGEQGIIIDEIGAALGLPLREAIVTRVDIAANLQMNNPPKNYFPYLSSLSTFDRNIIKGSLYYRQTYREFYFYDKLREAKKHNDPFLTPELQQGHILRYETRFKYQWFQFYFGHKIKAHELYGDASDVCCELIGKWYEMFLAVLPKGAPSSTFEMTKMGLLNWLLNEYNREKSIIELINSYSTKGDRKAARLKREVLYMLKNNNCVEDDTLNELANKVSEAFEAY